MRSKISTTLVIDKTRVEIGFPNLSNEPQIKKQQN